LRIADDRAIPEIPVFKISGISVDVMPPMATIGIRMFAFRH